MTEADVTQAPAGARSNGSGPRMRAMALYGGTATAALAAPRIARLLRRRMPKAAADGLAIAASIAAGWAAVGALERRHPFRDEWNESSGDVRTDVADLFISDGWGRAAAGAITTPLANLIAERRRGRGPLNRLPVPLQVTLMVLAYDLGHYTMHRVMHERVGWSLHAPHHSPERLYILNATRFHPIELAIDGIQEGIVLAVLDPSGDAKVAYQVARGIFGQIQHANIEMDSGVLNGVLSTPERHRWHHSTVASEGNTNYGAMVSVWDRAFGSDFLPDRPFESELGNGDPDYPESWLGQLLAPLR